MNKQEIQSKIEVIKSLMSHLEEEIITLEFELEADEKLEKLDKLLEKPKLMKDWDKPFKEWGDDRAAKGIKIVGNRIEFYACTSGCCSKYHNPCLENAEEFHNALGHAIAELKRKQTEQGD